MSSSEDGWIFFWDITPLQRGEFPHYHYLGCACLHRKFICQLKYDPVNQLLFSIADDGFIHAWNVPVVDPLNPHAQKNVTENELYVFSYNHGKLLSQDNSVLYCDISPNGRYLAAGTKSGSVYIWRIPYLDRAENGCLPRVCCVLYF